MVAKQDQQQGDVAPATAVPHKTSGNFCEDIHHSESERIAFPASETYQCMGVNGPTSRPISKTKLKRKQRAKERKIRSKAAAHKQVRHRCTWSSCIHSQMSLPWIIHDMNTM